MQKSAPSLSRILIAVGFALSCFLLMLFLWVSFGGPVPLKPESYRITAYFPEATQLANESDVRIGGVSVGKVKSVELAPLDKQVDGQDTTEAEIEIEPEFAPISSDARAILRQKTLLGETYVELTLGHQAGHRPRRRSRWDPPPSDPDAQTQDVTSIPEGGSLGLGQIQDATQIDEIFNALDSRPATLPAVAAGRGDRDQRPQPRPQRRARQPRARSSAMPRTCSPCSRRQQDAAAGPRPRHRARSSTPSASATGSSPARSPAPTQTFERLASEDQSLREFFQIAPTFENETRLTLQRLDDFQANTRPLVKQLLPVANDISPTLRSVRELSPNLRSLFIDLDDLTRASKRGFPAPRRLPARVAADARQPRPVPGQPDAGRLLAQLLPLQHHRLPLQPAGRACRASFRRSPGSRLPRHALKQLGYITQESLAVYPNRLPENRGNGYLLPYGDIIKQGSASRFGIFPNFDCDNTGGERIAGDGGTPTVSSYDEPNPPGRSWGRRMHSRRASSPRRSRTSSAAPSSRRSRKLLRLLAR